MRIATGISGAVAASAWARGPANVAGITCAITSMDQKIEIRDAEAIAEAAARLLNASSNSARTRRPDAASGGCLNRAGFAEGSKS
jgi:hypothetical protein